MALEYFDPREIEDNPYQGLATYNPDQVKQFATLFKEDADAGRRFPASGHPTPTGRRLPNGKIQLCDGHHRRDAFVALVAAGDKRFERFPVDVSDLDDDDMLAAVGETALNRKQMKPIDQARFFKALADHGWTQARISKRFSISQPMVSKYLAVLELPEGVLVWLDKPPADGEFTISHAYELIDLHREFPAVLQEFIKTKGKGLLWSEYGSQTIVPRGNVAHNATAAMLRAMKTICVIDGWKNFPVDWSPIDRTDIIGDPDGRCTGCKFVFTVDGRIGCRNLDTKCFDTKAERHGAESRAAEYERILRWAEANGFPKGKITQEAYRSYQFKMLGELEPCSAACECIRVAPGAHSGDDGEIIEAAPHYRHWCIEPKNRLDKARAVGRIEAAPGHGVDTPEMQARRARQERLDELCEELIRAYVSRLELAPLANVHEVDIFAEALGIKPKKTATETYRYAAEYSLRKIAKSWNHFSNRDGLDAPKLVSTIAGVEKPAFCRKVGEVTYIRLDTGTQKDCALCKAEAHSRVDPLFGGLKTAKDGEPVEPRYLCGHHLARIEILGEDEPEEPTPATKPVVVPDPEPAPPVTEVAPVEVLVTPPEGSVIRHSYNPNLYHFFDTDMGGTYCGRTKDLLDEIPQAGIEFKACPICIAAGEEIAAEVETAPAPTPAPPAFELPTPPNGFNVLYAPFDGTRYHFIKSGTQVTACGRNAHTLVTTPKVGHDYKACPVCKPNAETIAATADLVKP